MESSGKGRIELVDSKYTFAYESLIDRQKNLFELALDFPVIGETKVSLSLNPKDVPQQIRQAELIRELEERIGERADRGEIIRAIEEFFVFASDFMRYKAQNVYPSHFSSTIKDGHFIISRQTDRYHFQVDNFSENQQFFERTVFSIFLTSSANARPVLTLFLVPQSCDR